jgi:cell division septation protein DedD
MNVNVPVPAPEPRRMPNTEAIRKQRAVTKRWFVFLVALIALLTVALIVWVFFIASITKATVATLGPAANLTLVLAPVLAAAAGVERTLETAFNIIENSWKSLVAYLGRGLRWLNSAELEVDASRQWLADVSARYNQELLSLEIKDGMSASDLSSQMQDKIFAAKTMLDLAEKRLSDAENNLANATASDGYRNAKAAASIVLGLVIGVIVSTLGQLQMFAMLGIGSVPERVDVFITGLVIGTGSYPVHSLVGILQQTKETLDGAKGYLNRAGTPFTAQKTTEVRPTSEEPGAGQKVVEKVSVEPTEKPVSS